ncbi:MAG: xanthine phosphoribosyltransferase [Syntrophomonadaceae bacterium]|jgi:xanthine phosphoribosyltransferase|nr:xanthine phosphoribosyltransferase [Syntrophomonadaceae bacterium]
MQTLKEKILTEGKVLSNDILKVDNFLNHQLDVDFINEIGREFARRFKEEEISKILTIEASGIAVAALTAQYFKVPVVFAKKAESKNLDEEVYKSEVFSFTKDKNYSIMVSKKYLNPEDRVLIIDDFLANGRAALGLKDIVEQAGARLVGIGIVIEKGFQSGGKILRKSGIRVESLAIINTMSPGHIVFQD